MQGGSSNARRGGLASVVILGAAFTVAAGLVVAVLHQIGTLTFQHVPFEARVAICAVVAVAGIVADIRAAALKRFSLGLSRQTPKQLMHLSSRHRWLTPLPWGIDTGLIVTTYRVSFTSWMLLLAALLAVTPPWVGVVYGLSFAVPLTLYMFLGDAATFGRSGDRLRVIRPQLAQAGGSAALFALPVWLLWVYYVPFA